MTKTEQCPPLPLKCVVFIWGIAWLTFYIWSVLSSGLHETLPMLLTFDEAWLHSNSVGSILMIAVMNLFGLIAVPIICVKTYRGSLKAKAHFMQWNLFSIPMVFWGAFHITSFLFLAVALLPACILITMVSSEEIGKYFAVQADLGGSEA